MGDGGEELAHLFAQLEALVARSPLFDAAFALATAPDQAPVGTIHPAAAAAHWNSTHPPTAKRIAALRAMRPGQY